MATILMPIPSRDFDPSETGVPWRILSTGGHHLVFATPDGEPGAADERMVSGRGLGPLAAVLRADRNGRASYDAMIASREFQQPLTYQAAVEQPFDALLLAGGHAKGMRPYLESAVLQDAVVACFAAGKPVAAICHGVLLVARALTPSGRSVLHGRRTTALLRSQELLAWNLTRLYLGDYYRTYPITVEDEVTAALAHPDDFEHGPTRMTRDTPERPSGFAVVDGNYVSARWPGDAHQFAFSLAALLTSPVAERELDR